MLRIIEKPFSQKSLLRKGIHAQLCESGTCPQRPLPHFRCPHIVFLQDEAFRFQFIMIDIRRLRNGTHAQHEDKENDEIGVYLRFDIKCGDSVGIAHFSKKKSDEGIHHQNAWCHPHPCSERKMGNSISVDICEDGKKQHGWQIRQRMIP